LMQSLMGLAPLSSVETPKTALHRYWMYLGGTIKSA
jgi:hypothetical protein